VSKLKSTVLEEALIDDPHDVASWAAYSDLLTEEGNSRGEFVAVQLALENPELGTKERRRLRDRENKLLAQHEREWLGRLAPFLLDERTADAWWPVCEYRWERGRLAFVRIIHLFGVEFARVLVRCTEELRLLLELHIESPDYAGLDEYEHGPDVPKKVAGGDHAASLYVLCQAAWLSGLRVLRIGPWFDESDLNNHPRNIHVPGDQAQFLVQQMPRLEELYLMAYDVKTTTLFSLPLRNLRVLQVDHVDDYPFTRLAKNPTLRNLTHLLCHPKAHMHYHTQAHIRLPAVRALLRSPHLQKLAHLRLRLSDMGDTGCREIVESGALKRLKTLDLRYGCITDEGARVLAECPDLKTLEALDFAWNRLTRAGVRALRATGVSVEARKQYGPSDEAELYLYQGDYE
jgi:uncharacterized protein (TIGR02996 family)